MINLYTDHLDLIEWRLLPNGDKAELHNLTNGKVRLIVFSEDDQDWEWDDYDTEAEARLPFDEVESLDEMFVKKSNDALEN